MSISKIISTVETERVLVAKSCDPILESLDAIINVVTSLRTAWLNEIAERDAALQLINADLVRLVEGDKPVMKEAEEPEEELPDAA